ncbi:SPOR domain-containing protein [Pseudomonas lundensis]|uniref:SPOR domain-containing protein n=1 Tax=Pseudomonas lundensis TaxID=86185 RepID=A0A266NAG8_9PSED|nr:SPOR domain-containing protein [Pseudomonas lundensis]NMY38963.1 SPOR domain-containing protein [Pseudomonas sp. WS 5078]NMY61959.1 SPOR domain-containing protein [Pseudomonas sp. WS 5354]NMY74885.1 SPOR domain-containing protein [Pseudomonas sp. WS 5071]OZY59491.1 hypothetical protein CJF39_10265 [Pseudomonas lundensis]
MRKVIVMTAILALTACGQESNDKIQRAKAASETSTVQAPMAQWAVEVKLGETQALSDLTARLLEHGYSSYIAVIDGVQRVLLGPFNTRDEAQAMLTRLTTKLDNLQAKVIELPADQLTH